MGINSMIPAQESQPQPARGHQRSRPVKYGISQEFIERIARTAADVPEAFRRWNAERTARGAILRERIAAIWRADSTATARQVRHRLLAEAQAAGTLYDSHGRRTVPCGRAVQRHLRAIRRSADCEDERR